MRICLRKERSHWIKIRDLCHIHTIEELREKRMELERERSGLGELYDPTIVERRLRERGFVMDICEAAIAEEADVYTPNVSWRRHRLDELDNAYNAIEKIADLLIEDVRVAYPDDNGCAEGISNLRYYENA